MERRELLRRAPSMTDDELDLHVRMQLQDMGLAASSAPYWRERFDAAGIDGATLSPESLSDLPSLSKADIKESGHLMLSSTVDESRRKSVSTGGTTGTPLSFWIDRDASIIDWAHVVDAWGRIGFKLDEKRAVMRGVRLGAGESRELFRYEPIRRELYISVFDLDEKSLPEIRRRLRSFAARFIHGYPSAMEILAKSYVSAGETPPPLKGLLCVSENLHLGQREFLEEVFGCRAFSFYGMSEKVAFAAECSCSQDLHVDPLYGVVELLDEAGKVVTEPGVVGEIVATGLLSRSMPLIRYRTGDYAEWSSGPCACGSRYRRLARIVGRAQDYLLTKSSSRISMAALNLHSSAFARVRRFRFVQEHAGEALLLLVPGDGYSSRDLQAILGELNGKLAGQVALEIREVHDLPLSPIGKQQYIDQRVPARWQ